MKGYFVTFEDLSNSKLSGVQRKMLFQIEVFNKNNLGCTSYYMSDGSEKIGRLPAGVMALMPYGNFFPRWNKKISMDGIDYIYFRHPIFINWAMRHFLKHLKKSNPKLKVVMEIPTYPYEKEYNALFLKPFLFKDRYNRQKLSGLVDALAVVSPPENLKTIWGLPVIPFQNGYDVESVAISKKVMDGKEIHLLCIAMFNRWHGYERLLNGLIEYYQNGGQRKIICHFAGDGPELKNYKQIAEHEAIRNHVIFYGRLYTEELDALYDKIDIGICSLGLYKIDILGVSSVLKVREYVAKGIPVVVANETDIFQRCQPDFVCQFNNDDSVIEIDKIVDFYDRMCGIKDLKNKIRTFAKENVDINVTLKPIVDYIKGNRE